MFWNRGRDKRSGFRNKVRMPRRSRQPDSGAGASETPKSKYDAMYEELGVPRPESEEAERFRDTMTDDDSQPSRDDLMAEAAGGEGDMGKDDSQPQDEEIESAKRDIEMKKAEKKAKDAEKKAKDAEKKSEKDKKPGMKAAETKEKDLKSEDEMRSLIGQKEEIEALLSSIEDAYREATLPDKTYNEVKEKNAKKLEDIEKQIKKLVEKGIEKPKPEPKPEIKPEPVRMTPAPLPAAPPVYAPMPARDTIADAVKVVKDMEDRLEKRMKDVMAAASAEASGKKMDMLDDRMSEIQLAIKDIRSGMKKIDDFEKKMNKISAEAERSAALVEGTKEMKNIMDEKMQRLSDSFTEIKTLVYQREAQTKEMNSEFEKMKSAVAQVDTERVLHEFRKRDEQARDNNTRLERLEKENKAMTETMNKIKGLMTEVGSLENILKASKQVGFKLERIEEVGNKVKTLSDRLQGSYIEMKRRLDDFTVYKIKQDKIESMGNELRENTDDINRRLASYATRNDINDLKAILDGVRDNVRKMSTPKIPPEARPLQEEKEEILELMKSLEENVRNGIMKQEEYDNTREKNDQRLREIEEKLKQYMPGQASGQPSSDNSGKSGRKERDLDKVMLLAKLRESFEKGVISKEAYDTSRKTLLGK